MRSTAGQQAEPWHLCVATRRRSDDDTSHDNVIRQDGANHCARRAKDFPAVISSPAARRGKYYVAATTRRRTRNDGSEERRSARTMESERSELAGLNKMKEIEILNELMCTSQTSANYYIGQCVAW